MLGGGINFSLHPPCYYLNSIQFFKLAGTSFWLVGRRVVTKELAQLVREDAAEKKLAKYRKEKP